MRTFPSLAVRGDGLVPSGAFAEAQARFLEPDAATVAVLAQRLSETQTGVVSHFYMDAELQGALLATRLPHVHVSDSLAMADRAISMARAGVRQIVVLGVDFMSENVRAMLDASGFTHVPVYRVAVDPIGCSLAEAAEKRAYGMFLARAARTPRAVHVVYINTSLRSKAKAEARVPTLAVTSSNVVRAVMTAFAEIPEASVFFGPDTYMGRNLTRLFETLAQLPDAAVRSVHPAHDAASVAAFLPRFHHFTEGHCIVHHAFGHDVVETVLREHAHDHLTAHLEVPGEMFELALDASRHGRGVVGSTSDILEYIATRTRAAVSAEAHRPLRFVLGTETGMITSIVGRVRPLLAGSDVTVEIVFPVADGAITRTGDASLPVVPGAASGDGCGVGGGCATCPYMKMNTLEGLFGVLDAVARRDVEALATYLPEAYSESIGGRPVAELGTLPILRMQEFGATGHLSSSLRSAIRDDVSVHAV